MQVLTTFQHHIYVCLYIYYYHFSAPIDPCMRFKVLIFKTLRFKDAQCYEMYAKTIF